MSETATHHDETHAHHEEKHEPPAPSDGIRSLYSKLAAQAKEMADIAEGSAEVLDKKFPEVSQWSVGQHIDHMAMVNKQMIPLVLMAAGSAKPVTEGEPKFMGRVVLWTGFIPRGKGKSPDAVLPKSKTHDEIRANVKTSQTYLTALEAQLLKVERSPAKVPHPALGAFTPAQWMRFIEIHNNHHFKIIRDIRKRS